MTATPIEHPEAAPYRQPAEAVLAGLAADPHAGLSEEEARARLDCQGRNELAPEKPVPAWKKFFAQFMDPLVILLLVATLVSAWLWFIERESALPTQPSPSSRSCCSMRSWATFSRRGLSGGV
jgi:Ca2+-transporting ATPase